MAERILIVDDEVDMLELLKRIIEDKTPIGWSPLLIPWKSLNCSMKPLSI